MARHSVAGVFAIASLIALGSTGLAAAQAFDPMILKDHASGVVGSGPNLSLRIMDADGAARTLKIGDVYQDGWRLIALTPSQATLFKAGTAVGVGLNPSGAVAAADTADNAPPSSVTFVSEDARVQSDNQRIAAALAARRASGATPQLNPDDIHALLGDAAYAEWDAYNQREMAQAQVISTINTPQGSATLSQAPGGMIMISGSGNFRGGVDSSGNLYASPPVP